MLNRGEASLMKLIDRSPDCGEGWREVSKQVWPIIESFRFKELIEIDKDNMRIRLTHDGKVVFKYAVC